MKPATISDYLIALFELVEAEGREFKKQGLNMGFSLGLIVLGFIVLLASFGFLIWSVYGFLSQVFSVGLTFFFMFILTFILAIIIFGISKWISR